MKRKYIVTFIIFAISIMSYPYFDYIGSDSGNRDVLSIDEMRSDFNQLKSAFKETHPIAIIRIPDRLDKVFDDAYKRLDKPLSIPQFSVILAETLAQINDAHTELPAVLDGPEIPLMIKIIDNHFYVLNGYKDITPGCEVLDIAGVPIDVIFKEYCKQYSSGNEYWKIELFEERYIEVNKVLSLSGNKTVLGGVKITYIKGGDKKIVNLYKNDFVYKQYNDLAREGVLYSKYNKLMSVNRSNRCYGYFIDPEENFVYLKMIACLYDDEYKAIISEIFDRMSQKNIRNIIIDLRGNQGGDSSVIDEFIKQLNDANQHLNSNEDVNYDKIEVFALVDHKTFSSAALFASFVTDLNIGLVIGQPTGGTVPSYGNIQEFYLNHSKLWFTVSNKFVMRINSSKSHDDSVYPDINSIYTITDYIEGIDRDLEIVKSIIVSRRVQ